MSTAGVADARDGLQAERPEVPWAGSSGPGPGTLGFAQLAVVALIVVFLGWYRRWTSDDAFIDFRIVENLLHGDGPVFTPGFRVEAGTSPLWIGLMALFSLVPGTSIEWVSVLLGLALTGAGFLFAGLGGRRLLSWRSPAALPFGVLLAAGIPAIWDFATSGLETGLIFGWLGLSWWSCTRCPAPRPRRSTAVVAAVVVGLGPLVRPDLAVITVALGAWLLAVTPGWRRRGLVLGAAAVLPLAYQIFRMGYFGLLVPNTAIAKESSRALWSRGFGYLMDFVDAYDLYLMAAVATVGLLVVLLSLRGDRARTGLVLAALLGAAADLVYVVRLGGDFMHARMLLPGTFLVLTTVSVVPVTRRSVVWVTGLVATAAALSTVTALTLRVDYQGAFSSRGIADERGFWARSAGKSNPVTLADHGTYNIVYGDQIRALDATDAHLIVTQDGIATPGPRVSVLGPSNGRLLFIVGNAGFLGVAAGRTTLTLDIAGLTDGVGSHLEPGPPGRPGHEKVEPFVWFWARYGAATEDVPRTRGLDPAGVAAARAALRCGRLADLMAATTDRLSPHRFWQNLIESRSLTSMRIPTDPTHARALFCGDGHAA